MDTCKICGKEYTKKTSLQKYCSKKCCNYARTINKVSFRRNPIHKKVNYEKEIAKVSVQSRQLGMSYGDCVLKHQQGILCWCKECIYAQINNLGEIICTNGESEFNMKTKDDYDSCLNAKSKVR